ncbi:phage tail tube protein [Pseudomonas benzopyrenica]|uniref:Phage tail tube protein n=1 Tax=Pseudomonas benzopyrenica TaxID=2993566 RepID=A0ABZ2FKR6_9PSED|nr:phage tail tube protein [uncultured Pseudomonas sp.]
MSINTGAGTRFAIGPILTADLPKDSAAAITQLKGITYVQVGELENIGDYGDEAADVSFTGLSDGRVRHLKGAFDAGTVALPVALDAGDAGQVAMVAAQKNRSRYNYPFQVTYVDGQVDYFVGKVMSSRKTNIQNGDVLRRSFNVGINSEIFETTGSA